MRYCVIIILMLISGCSKKFAEDDGITSRSPLERIYGSWLITSYNINGEESPDDIKAMLGVCYGSLVFMHEGIDGLRIYGDSCMIFGGFGFYNKLNSISLTFSFGANSLYVYPFSRTDIQFLHNNSKWDILKLDNSGIILQSVNDNGQKLHATKIK